MIAVCPKCQARYRIARERLTPEGVRLRCTRCQGVFRVRAPEDTASATAREPSGPVEAPRKEVLREPPRPAEAPATAGPGAAAAGRETESPEAAGLVLVALPDAELAKQTVELLDSRGLRAAMVHDGVEAMLAIQRMLPRAVLLSATLPRMYGFQICEIVKRNESLRSTFVVLAGAVHHRDRYRRPARDLHGADAYLEEPDLPEGLLPLLARAGLPLPEAGAPSQEPPAAPPGPGAPGQTPAVAPPEPGMATRRPEPSPPPGLEAKAATPAEPQKPAAPVDDGLAEARVRAERLARIIVSDIVLYNEAKFAEAVRAGSVREALAAELDEGRALFRERVDARVREERDHLMEELLRVASRRAED